jgi:hypothetical protein
MFFDYLYTIQCLQAFNMSRPGNRNAILNFCRPVSHGPSPSFEWKDFDLASCAIEVSGTLISEYLRGVREVCFIV